MDEEIISYLFGVGFMYGIPTFLYLVGKYYKVMKQNSFEKNSIPVIAQVVQANLEFSEVYPSVIANSDTVIHINHETSNELHLDYRGFDVGDKMHCRYNPKNGKIQYDSESVMSKKPPKANLLKDIVYAVLGYVAICLVIFIFLSYGDNFIDSHYRVYFILGFAFLVFLYGYYDVYKRHKNKNKLDTSVNYINVIGVCRGNICYVVSTEDEDYYYYKGIFVFEYNGEKRAYYGADESSPYKCGNQYNIFINPDTYEALVEKRE